MPSIRKTEFYSIPFSIFTHDEFDQFVVDTIINDENKVVYGFSLHSIYSLKTNPEIILIGRHADVIVSDGRVLFWLLKLYKVPVMHSLSIPEAVIRTLKIADNNKFSLFLLGATAEINEKARQNIMIEYPNIKIVGFSSGYFNMEEGFDKVLSEIQDTQPDILLIGISSPKKEIIGIKFKERVNAKLIIPCGGMIDVLAGKTKMAPRLIKKLGLASFYRIFQEPKRLLSDRIRFYLFVFFNFLPFLCVHSVLLRNKNISIINLFKRKQFDVDQF